MNLDLDRYQESLELARIARRPNTGGLIRRGSGNRQAVKALQTRLSELGYGLSTDGVFGQQTEKALRQFQDSRGAKIDGVVGKETLGKLLRAHKPDGNLADPSIDAIRQVVAPGTSGVSARSGTGLGRLKAQQAGGGANPQTGGRRRASRGSASTTPKGAHGGAIDPVTGAERASSSTGPIGSTQVRTPTQASWERGQVRGSDPQATQGQQAEDNNPQFNAKHPRSHGKFIAKGATGDDVSNVQDELNNSNESGLKVDGKFGPKTQKAVKTYQRQAGLTVDGIVGPKTSASLRRRTRLAKQANAGTTPVTNNRRL